MFARSGPTYGSHVPMTKLYRFYLRQLPKKPTNTFLLASSLIFEMSISGGSAKRQWYSFFGTYCMVFFEIFFFCSTEGFRVVTFSLFIYFVY